MCAQCTHMIWYFACYSIYTCCGNLLHIIASFDKGKHAANAFRYTQSQRWGNIIFRYSIQEGRQTNSKALLRWICQYIPKLENVQIESNQWYVLQFANWKDIWVLYCWLFHNSTGGKMHQFDFDLFGKNFKLLKVSSWIPLWSNMTFCNRAVRDSGAKSKYLKRNLKIQSQTPDSPQSIQPWLGMQTGWQKVSLPWPLEPMESRALKSGHPVGHSSFYLSFISKKWLQNLAYSVSWELVESAKANRKVLSEISTKNWDVNARLQDFSEFIVCRPEGKFFES